MLEDKNTIEIIESDLYKFDTFVQVQKSAVVGLKDLFGDQNIAEYLEESRTIPLDAVQRDLFSLWVGYSHSLKKEDYFLIVL